MLQSVMLGGSGSSGAPVLTARVMVSSWPKATDSTRHCNKSLEAYMLVDVCHMCDTVNAEMLGYVVAGGGRCSTCRGRCQAREHSERGLTLSCLETLWSYTGIVWETSRTGVRPRGGSPTDLVKSCSCFTIILSFCSYWQYLC